MRLPACGDSVATQLRGTRVLALSLSALLLFSAACSSSSGNGGATAGVPGRSDAGRPGAGGPGGGPNGSAGGGPGGFGGAQQQVGVVTAEASQGALGLEIEAIGNAVANESTEITSKTVNTVTAIRFTEGQLVRKGDVLVEFDSVQARADLAAAQAAFAESASQYKRSRELFSTQALSQSQLDTLDATLKSNEAKVLAAKSKVEDTIIRAPFSGRMGLRRVSLGGLVSPGTVISTLDDTSVVKLDFTVPQAYMFSLQPGLP